jgi:hypothetical protein
VTPETLNFWAAASAIYLFINAIVITLFTGIALGFVWWYLRKGRKALVKPLLMAQVYALRVQLTTSKVADKIAGVPIEINAAASRVTTTTKMLSSPKDGKSNGSNTPGQSN